MRDKNYECPSFPVIYFKMHRILKKKNKPSQNIPKRHPIAI